MKMSWLQVFQRRQEDEERARELEDYLARETEENTARGMPPEEARRVAHVKLGNVRRIREEIREMNWTRWMETLWQDLKYAARVLRKSPGFTAVAVLTLALGIGANTAIFTVAYNILFRQLPFGDASRIVMVWEDDSAYGFPQNTPSPGNFSSWRAQNNVFTDVAAMGGRTFNLTGHGNPEEFLGMQVTANMFPLLGVKPALGRNILPSEDKPGANQVVILSHGVWVTNFGGDPQIAGKQVSLNDKSYTVIGVMPRGFIFPDRTVQMWVPIGFSEKDLADYGDHYLHVLARLKPRVSLSAANADLSIIAKRLQQLHPDSNAKEGAYAVPLRERLAGNSRVAAIVLLGAVGFVLLIACANVANLLLARAAGRQRELAMRMVLGAGRGRILRQLLTESILLSTIAGGAGLLFAIWATPSLAVLVPEGLAPISAAGANIEVLAFLIAASVLCGILFGLAPTLRVSRADLFGVIKQGGAQSGLGSGGRHMRDALVVAEVALALVLFSGATLMLRSFINVRDVDPGFRPAHVLAVSMDLPFPKYRDVARRNAFFQQVLDRVNHLPGVVAAGCTTWLPLTNWGGAGGIQIEGQPKSAGGQMMIPNWRMISDNYIQAIGMKLMEGRTFNPSDGANTPLVALVNQTAAKRFWRGANPLGTRFQHYGDDKNPWVTVVGIVGDVRQVGLDQPARPEIYLPYQQWNFFAPGYLAVRTSGDPLSVANAVRQQIWAVDKDQPVFGAMPLETMLEDYLAPRELQSSLLGGFAGFALLLAALGIYGVNAFSVSQRTQEIGVRVALGAQRGQILRLIIIQGLKLAGLGVAIGVAGALGLTRLMSSLLYGVSATDPPTFAIVTVVLALVALAACYIPARRAMKVDPMVALRYE